MKKFTTKVNEDSTPISYQDALEQYIFGQKVMGTCHQYGSNDKSYYGDGLILENNFKWITQEETNTSYIVDAQDKLVAKSTKA